MIKNNDLILDTSGDGSGGSGGRRSGAAEERQKSWVYRLLIIQKQILRNPKRTMGADNSTADHDRRYEERSDAGEEHNDDGEYNK